MSITYSADKFDDILRKAYGKRKPGKSENIPYTLLSQVESLAAAKLTYRQKECFFMYYKENKNITQVAKNLNLTSPTVCRHLQKARAKTFRELKNFSHAKPVWS